MSGTLNFWARRKALVRQEQEAEARERQTADDAAHHAALEERSDADVLDELGLPDPDTLRPGDDFAAFLAREVPQRLQRRALRRLWVSNPVLACVDGLNDYDGDFTAAATGVTGVLKTAYQVGRGIVRDAPDPRVAALQGDADERGPDAERPEGSTAEALAGELDASGDNTDHPAAFAPEMAADRPAPATTCAQTAPADAATNEPAIAEARPARRRMRFAFAGAQTDTETG